MVRYPKKPQINTNTEEPSLEEIKTILLMILPKQTVSGIIKVLPMYSPMTSYLQFREESLQKKKEIKLKICQKKNQIKK